MKFEVGDYVFGLFCGHESVGVVMSDGVHVLLSSGRPLGRTVDFASFSGIRSTNLFQIARWEASFRHGDEVAT